MTSPADTTHMTRSDIHVRPVDSASEQEALRALRVTVFVDEQGVDAESEFDEFENTSRHFTCLLGQEIVGTARWRAVHDNSLPAAKLERFAILKKARGKGYGHALVESVLADARRAGFSRFVLHAQAHLKDFYATHGFVVDGPVFVEEGIEHVLMRRVDGTPSTI
jgi:predicted GNAT family N-acyltransferase